MAKVTVKRTDKNYGLALTGKIGSRPDLEEEYVRKFIAVDDKDGIVSLREAVKDYEKNGEAAWAKVVGAQKQLEGVKAKLLEAGYTMPDLMKLTLDNS